MMRLGGTKYLMMIITRFQFKNIFTFLSLRFHLKSQKPIQSDLKFMKSNASFSTFLPPFPFLPFSLSNHLLNISKFRFNHILVPKPLIIFYFSLCTFKMSILINFRPIESITTQDYC